MIDLKIYDLLDDPTNFAVIHYWNVNIWRLFPCLSLFSLMTSNENLEIPARLMMVWVYIIFETYFEVTAILQLQSFLVSYNLNELLSLKCFWGEILDLKKQKVFSVLIHKWLPQLTNIFFASILVSAPSFRSPRYLDICVYVYVMFKSCKSTRKA